MEIATIISILSAIVAVYASFIAKRNLDEQKRIAKLSGNVQMLQDTHKLMVDSPELLKLHNVSVEELNQCQVTPKELVYIISSFNAAYFYYDVEGKKKLNQEELSNYRKTFLNSKKVKLVWENIIKPKMSIKGSFADSIDRYYSVNKPTIINDSNGS